MALAQEYFAEDQSTLDGLLLYIAWYGSGEGIVFERNRHDDVFGLMTVTFFLIWSLDGGCRRFMHGIFTLQSAFG